MHSNAEIDKIGDYQMRQCTENNKYMKVQLSISLFLLLPNFVLGQKITLLVTDKTTMLPVPEAMVFYPKSGNSNFTNDDGLTYLYYESDSITINNLDYVLQKIKPVLLKDTLKIQLIPKTNMLDEVTVTAFDLVKSSQYVLENYKNIYVDHPVNRECTFKEVVKFDNQYKRLIQTQLNWWSKYSYNLQKKEIGTFCTLILGNIEFFKNDTLKATSIKEGGDAYITKGGLMHELYLNIHISQLLEFKDYIKQTSIETTNNTIYVTYETSWKKFTNGQVRLTGHIVFDKKKKGILELEVCKYFKEVKEVKISKRDSEKYETETQKEIQTLRFVENGKGFLSFKYSGFNGHYTVKFLSSNETHSVDMNNTFFVLSEIAQKKPNKENLVDLDKPIYKSISTNIPNRTSVLMSKEEQEFLNGK